MNDFSKTPTSQLILMMIGKISLPPLALTDEKTRLANMCEELDRRLPVGFYPEYYPRKG